MSCWILIVLGMDLWVGAHANPSLDSLLQNLWKTLDQKYSGLENQDDLVDQSNRARIDRLRHQESYTIQPAVNGSWSDVQQGLHQVGTMFQWQNPQWQVQTSAYSNIGGIKSGSLQVGYILGSSLSEQVGKIQTSRQWTRHRTRIQREQLFFLDFKSVLSQGLQYEIWAREIKQRQEIGTQGEAYIRFLNRTIQAGGMSVNEIKGLQVFLSDNELQIKALRHQQDLLCESLALNWGLDSLYLLSFNSQELLGVLDWNRPVDDYAWTLDSLSIQEQKALENESEQRIWSLTVGASSSFGTPVAYSSLYSYTNSIYLQYTSTFGWSRRPQVSIPLRPIHHYPKSAPEQILQEYQKAVLLNAQQIQAMNQNVMERLKLGEHGIIDEISQNLSLMLNQDIRGNSLWQQTEQLRMDALHQFSQLPPSWRPPINAIDNEPGVDQP